MNIWITIEHKITNTLKEISNDTINMVSSIEGLNNVKSMITSMNMSEISKYRSSNFTRNI